MAVCVSNENPALRDQMLQWNPSHPEVGTLIDENLLFKVDVLNFFCVWKMLKYHLALKHSLKLKLFKNVLYLILNLINIHCI